jgi:pyruvate-ferredoxin/flavodoxin oxidoreductase
MMGSGAETAHETVTHLAAQGEKVGLVKVRLYRPFDVEAFVASLPASARRVAVLDRTKEPGAVGDPLYVDVLAALSEARAAGQIDAVPAVIAGRYGLSSKEFTPADVKAVFDELSVARPKPHFTVGIVDDVTRLSLTVDHDFDLDATRKSVVRGVFFGLGSDGTVGANKNSIKIIGEETDNFAQGYFVYDSKKAGAITISHLRFGPDPIQSSYLIKRASFLACHQYEFLDKFDVLDYAEPGAVFLLNAPFGPDDVWERLSAEVQTAIVEKGIRFYVIDGYAVARDAGMGSRINTIMQTCFFAISGVLPREEAIAHIKGAIKKTYGKRGDAVVQANFAAVDKTLAHLHEVKRPAAVDRDAPQAPPIVSDEAPDFVQARHGGHHGQQGGPAAGQRLPGGRHLAHGHDEVGEAEPRDRHPGVGRGALHPVQQVRDGLPARGGPREGTTRRTCSAERRRPSRPWTSRATSSRA